jgi:hypothetical protein
LSSIPDLHLEKPCEGNDFLAGHVVLLSNSLEHWSGRSLIEDRDNPGAAARRLYYAPFVLLSHGVEKDPIINYANITAQKLFEMNWSRFVQFPSRLSAEAVLQTERKRLLQRVTEHGFIDDYSGVRISSSGKRFLIDQATVWNLQDGDGRYYGQAAMFSNWKNLA